MKPKYKISGSNGKRFVVRAENILEARKEAMKISTANQVYVEREFKVK